MIYKISGKVVRGDGYGRKLGFPTVNLETLEQKLPPAGIYAGSAVLNDKNYRAGILINPNGKVEAHLIGYRGDAYGNVATLETKKFLREYKKFETEQELKEQIAEDLEKC